MLSLLLLFLLSPLRSHSLASSSTAAAPSGSDANEMGVIIRGADKYGTQNNSTILSPTDAALRVGVKPTKEATKLEWQRAWRMHRVMMKPLHWFDGCRPTDSKLALACLWWKAIAGNDITSPVYDYSLSYDLLPPVTRWVVQRNICKFYPRLHHANVEIRTAYLDKALTNVINTIMDDDHHDDDTVSTMTTATFRKKKKIRLVVMGGGYDTRSIKLLEHLLLMRNNTEDNTSTTTSSSHFNLLRRKRHRSHSRTTRRRWYHRVLGQTYHSTGNSFENITSSNYELEAYELDLPEVVAAKRKLLSLRLFRRRPWLLRKSRGVGGGGGGGGGIVMEDEVYPKLIEADFNDLNGTRNVLEGILLSPTQDDDVITTNIILFEGVMIYLEEGIPHSLLNLCSEVLRKGRQKYFYNNNDSNSLTSTVTTTTATTLGYLCFADRLENIPGGDEDAARVEMESTGWELIDWLSKPGLARHMGVARVFVE